MEPGGFKIKRVGEDLPEENPEVDVNENPELTETNSQEPVIAPPTQGSNPLRLANRPGTQAPHQSNPPHQTQSPHQTHATQGVRPKSTCPECHTEVEPGAVLCIACGYNIQQGGKIKTRYDMTPRRPAGGGKRTSSKRGPSLLSNLIFYTVVLGVIGGAAYYFFMKPAMDKASSKKNLAKCRSQLHRLARAFPEKEDHTVQCPDTGDVYEFYWPKDNKNPFDMSDNFYIAYCDRHKTGIGTDGATKAFPKITGKPISFKKIHAIVVGTSGDLSAEDQKFRKEIAREYEQPKLDPNSAESVARAYMVAIVSKDPKAIQEVILPNPNAKVLWEGETPKDGSHMYETGFVELELGGSMIVGPGKIVEVTKKMLPPGTKILQPIYAGNFVPIPIFLKKVNGAWKVNASELIGSKMRLAAKSTGTVAGNLKSGSPEDIAYKFFYACSTMDEKGVKAVIIPGTGDPVLWDEMSSDQAIALLKKTMFRRPKAGESIMVTPKRKVKVSTSMVSGDKTIIIPIVNGMDLPVALSIKKMTDGTWKVDPRHIVKMEKEERAAGKK